MNSNFKYELGENAKDIITGFSGIIMGRVQYLTGCNQYAISPVKTNKDGSRPGWEYFDENRILVLKNKKRIVIDTGNPTKRGFDGTHP